MAPTRAPRIYEALSLLALLAPLPSCALSSTSPQDLFAHPRYQLVLTQTGITNASAVELLARDHIPGEAAYHLLRTTAGQGFLCTVPPATTALIQPAAARAAEENRRQAREDKKAGLERGLALLEPLKGSCLYLRQGWFTYAFCHGTEIRQFHEIRQAGSALPGEDPNSEAYTLGQYAQPSAEVVAGSGTGALQDVLAGGGAFPGLSGSEPVEERRYLSQRWRHGTVCDKTGLERSVEVQFHCNTQSTDRIALIRETAICEYVLVVHTPRLCGEPVFLGGESDLLKSTTLETRCQPILGPPVAASALSEPPSSSPAPLFDMANVIQRSEEKQNPAPLAPEPALEAPFSQESSDEAERLDKAHKNLVAALGGEDNLEEDQDFIVTFDLETGDMDVQPATNRAVAPPGPPSPAAASSSSEGTSDVPKPTGGENGDGPTIQPLEQFTEILQRTLREAIKSLQEKKAKLEAEGVLGSNEHKHAAAATAVPKQRQVPVAGVGAKAPEQGQYIGSSKHHRLARIYGQTFGEAAGEDEGEKRPKDEL